MARKVKSQYTIESCKQIALTKGGKCLSETYTNTITKMYWECPLGHKWEATFSKILIGRWCHVCAGNKKKTIEDMISLAKLKNGKCLSTEYVNDKHKLLWECEFKHQWKASPGHIKTGTWCVICAGKEKHTIEFCKNLAISRGGDCLSGVYENCDNKLIWKCSNNHTWEASLNKIQQNRWCPYCSSSKTERIIRSCFEQLFGEEFPKSHPSWLKNSRGYQLELDGYCEKLNLAFEYNGEQHYSIVSHFSGTEERLLKQKQNDLEKSKVCKDNSITLIQIPYIKNLNNSKEIILNILLINNIKIEKDVDLDLKDAWINTDDRLIEQKLVKIIEDKDGKLIGKYISSTIPVEINCGSGHIFKSLSGNIRKGSWCPKCNWKKVIDKKYVDDLAKKKGGECLSEFCENLSNKLKWKCCKGHIWQAKVSKIEEGSWCLICSGSLKKTINDMHELAANKNGKCLSEVYINNYSKLNWECNLGHVWEAVPSSIQQGCWCPECSKVSQKANIRKLSDAAENDICEKFKNKQSSKKELAKLYNVALNTITNVIKRNKMPNNSI